MLIFSCRSSKDNSGSVNESVHLVRYNYATTNIQTSIVVEYVNQIVLRGVTHRTQRTIIPPPITPPSNSARLTKGTLIPAEADDEEEEEEVLEGFDPAPDLDPDAPALEPDFPVAEAATDV